MCRISALRGSRENCFRCNCLPPAEKNEFSVIIQRIVWLSKASGVSEECEFEKIDIDSTGATFPIIHNVLFEWNQHTSHTLKKETPKNSRCKKKKKKSSDQGRFMTWILVNVQRPFWIVKYEKCKKKSFYKRSALSCYCELDYSSREESRSDKFNALKTKSLKSANVIKKQEMSNTFFRQEVERSYRIN